MRFFFLGGRKNRQHLKKKERKKQQERERERTREKKRHEKELERTRESFNQKHLNHKSTTFCSREKKNTENFVSQHIKWRAQKRRQS